MCVCVCVCVRARLNVHISRSGLSAIGIVALGGVIDPTYEGGVKAIMANFGETDCKVELGKSDALLYYNAYC